MNRSRRKLSLPTIVKISLKHVWNAFLYCAKNWCNTLSVKEGRNDGSKSKKRSGNEIQG